MITRDAPGVMQLYTNNLPRLSQTAEGAHTPKHTLCQKKAVQWMRLMYYYPQPPSKARVCNLTDYFGPS